MKKEVRKLFRQFEELPWEEFRAFPCSRKIYSVPNPRGAHLSLNSRGTGEVVASSKRFFGGLSNIVPSRTKKNTEVELRNQGLSQEIKALLPMGRYRIIGLRRPKTLNSPISILKDPIPHVRPAQFYEAICNRLANGGLPILSSRPRTYTLEENLTWAKFHSP